MKVSLTPLHFDICLLNIDQKVVQSKNVALFIQSELTD